MKRSEYPSQKKYRENNPSASFRLKRQDKEKLDAIIEASGKPLSKWMRDFIHDDMDPQEEISELANNYDTCKEWAFELEAKNKELETRIKELENEERFNVPCSVCGKPMKFSSKYSNWESKVYPKLKQAFSTWSHVKKCEPK